ncbi:uncharacterized protein LOC130691656 [Daphnia carinata]|uniref:uncharacterized protein LOC130691656 n=1 Tax=Daphnia carinata TaxID=120202 RepID=UPI00257AD693|nr:uncharacterized protein LOC130691656 [Daphnia carinata]
MPNIIQTTLNYPALTCNNGENNIWIACSILEQVNSPIGDTEASSLSNEEKQITEKLLNETKCCGYFITHVSSIDFKCLYPETFNDQLDTYILKHAKENNFLQDICYQLVDCVSWLHERSIYRNSKLHPGNIFIKTFHSQWKVKLIVSENPFHNLDQEYINLWSEINPDQDLAPTRDGTAIQRDLASVIILLFFIQSAGAHPFQITTPVDPPQPKKHQGVKEQIERHTFSLVALDRKCFCQSQSDNCENPQCKYRFWVNMLAKDCTHSKLTEVFHNKTSSYTRESLREFMEHPFFWKTSGVLRFIEQSSNYLKEAQDKEKENKFGYFSPSQSNKRGQRQLPSGPSAATRAMEEVIPWRLDSDLLTKIKTNYKNIFEYLHEKPPKKFLPCITIYYELLNQIRNKSSHWNETTACGTRAREDLERITFGADSNMDVQHKYCLFWNIHFPKLILYTWKNLKDVVASQ